MSNSGGIISSPVRVLADVKPVLGISSNSVRLQIVTAKSGGTNGLAFDPSTGRKHKNAMPYGNIYSNNSPYQWYMATDSNGVGTGEIYCRIKMKENPNLQYRLKDWDKYNHNSKQPKVDLSINSLNVTVKNNNTSSTVVPWTLYTGDYDWRNGFDASYNNQVVRYIINFYYGYQTTSSGFKWFLATSVPLSDYFTGVGQNLGRNEYIYNMIGSPSDSYSFKASLSMQYEYYPGTVKEKIKPVTFSNQDNVLLESKTIPLKFIKELPNAQIIDIWCWYTDYDTGDPDYTAATLISDTLGGSSWSITMFLDSSMSDYDWDFEPNVYMTVYDKDDNRKYNMVYCNKFPLRQVPINDNYKFSVTIPSSVNLSLGDKVVIDIKG